METSMDEKEPQQPWGLPHQDAGQQRTSGPTPPKTSPFTEAEALVSLLQTAEQGPRMDVGTSPSPLSFSGAPSIASQTHSPSLHSDMEQHCPAAQRAGDDKQPGCAPPSSGLLTEPSSGSGGMGDRQKLLSDKISGTGTFILQRDESCFGDAARAVPLEQRSVEDQEQHVKHAYVAVEAVCQALVPGESMDLLDALMDTSEVYRARYGSKKLDFDNQDQKQMATLPPQVLQQPRPPQQEADDGAGDEVVPITQPFRGIGTFCLRKDKNTRKRRSEFVRLARSQRARVVKTAYEVVQGVTELFCPGERLLLLDRIFNLHHAIRARIQKKTTAALAAYPEAAALGAHAAALLSSQSTAAAPAASRRTQQGSASASSSISSSSAAPTNRKRPSPHSTAASSSSAMAVPPPLSHPGSDNMWLTSPTSADNTDDEENGGSLGGSSKHFRSDPMSGGGGSASSGGFGHPSNLAAQFMAAQWAAALAATGVAPVFMPSGGATPMALASMPFPYQHHMMMTSNAAAATPYFFPALSHPSAAISPSCQASNWSPGPGMEADHVTGAGAGPDDDVYGGALDDSSSTLTTSRAGDSQHGDDSTTIDGGDGEGGSGDAISTRTMAAAVGGLGITQI